MQRRCGRGGVRQPDEIDVRPPEPRSNLVQPPTMLVLLPDFVDDKELEDRRGITRSMAPDAANGSRQEKWPD
jgi:hypothetical protein